MKKYVVWLALVCLYASPVGFVALTGCGKDGSAEKIDKGDWSEEKEKAKAKEMEKEMMEAMKKQQADMQKGGGGGGIPSGPVGPTPKKK